jgi:hypothetical protein
MVSDNRVRVRVHSVTLHSRQRLIYLSLLFGIRFGSCEKDLPKSGLDAVDRSAGRGTLL